MKILYFSEASRNFFIQTFMEKYRCAMMGETLPKVTECQLIDLPFKIVEHRHSFVADIYGQRQRFRTIWTMADWIYKKLRNGKYYIDDEPR